MFASSVRETVFSNPKVIQRVNKEFVPLYISPLYSPGMGSADPEFKLFQSLSRSQVASQGMCVVNTGGQALFWVMNMGKEDGILSFLDHALKRFRKFPDARKQVMTERYVHFPDHRLDDFKEEVRDSAIAQGHPDKNVCPLLPLRSRQAAGTLMADVVGRALDADGKPMKETVNQARYSEDRFYVSPKLQEAVAEAIAGAETDRFPLPDELIKLCAVYSYLGVMDVAPKDEREVMSAMCSGSLWAWKPLNGSSWMRVEGSSRRLREGKEHDYRHEVKLVWEGFIEMEGTRMKSLFLFAKGRESRQWKPNDTIPFDPVPPSDVRYGIIGKPVRGKPIARGSGRVLEGPPDSIPKKMQRLQQGIKKWRQQGKGQEMVPRFMERFRSLMQQRKFKEAEAVLDEALQILKKER